MSQRSGIAAKRPRVSGASAAQAASRSAIPATFPTAQSFSVPAMEPLRSPRSRACTPLHVKYAFLVGSAGNTDWCHLRASSRIDAAATATTRHRGETKPTRRTVRGAGRATARRRLANAVVLRPGGAASTKPFGKTARGARRWCPVCSSPATYASLAAARVGSARFRSVSRRSHGERLSAAFDAA